MDMTPTPESQATMTVRIVGHSLPGLNAANRRNLHIGVQRGAEAVDLAPADARTVTFTIPVRLEMDATARLDFRGPSVHGKPGARFLYLTWGDIAEDGRFEMVQRLKIGLSGLDEAMIAAAREPGVVLQGSLGLTDQRGRPMSASVPAGRIDWAVVGPGE